MNLEGATKSHVLFVPQVPRTSRDIPGIYMNLEALRNGMGEVNDETKHLSSDVQRSKRVLRPRNSRGRCVPPKKRIGLFRVVVRMSLVCSLTYSRVVALV